MSQETITLLDRRTNQPADAILHSDLGQLRLVEVEIVWAPERLRGLLRLLAQGATTESLPQHVHWNWAIKAVQYAHIPGVRYLGIEAEGQMQGLMMVSLTDHFARVAPDERRPLVYVEYLETAPWNAREFTTTPHYGGVGRRLLQGASRLSSAEGFDGRVGLHTLPQSQPFYAGSCGFTGLGPDDTYHQLEYFELTAAQAVVFLED